MKKFAKITAVVLLAVLALTALVACGYPSDPDKAAAQLKKKDYLVRAAIGSENKLTQAELDAQAISMGLKTGDIIATVMATKSSDDGKGEMITIIYFKDSSVAKSVFDDMKDDIKKQKEEAEELEIKYSCKRAGNKIVTEISGDVSKLF